LKGQAVFNWSFNIDVFTIREKDGIAMPTSTQRQMFIEQIRQLPSQLTTLVKELSIAQLTTPYLPNEWTVAQNVHHLADSHMNSYIRCKLIATENRPDLKPYNQDQWALFDDAKNSDISVSLALLTSLHMRWTTFWQTLPEDAWQRIGYHPDNGDVSLEMQLEIYAAHGLGHLDQIRRTLAAQSTNDT
jgi:hypothetical protein